MSLKEEVKDLKKRVKKLEIQNDILLSFIGDVSKTNDCKRMIRKKKKTFQRDYILKVLYDNKNPQGLRTKDVGELLPELNRKQIHNGLTQMSMLNDGRVKRPRRGVYKFGSWEGKKKRN